MKWIRKVYASFKEKRIFLYIAIIVAALGYSALSIVRHLHFESGAFDLGIFDQAIWQFSHFLYPYDTVKMKFILADHFSPILILFAPLFWIWSNAIMLLLFQAIWVSLSAVPIYAYLRLKKFSNMEATIISCMYLFYFGIQFAIFFDFHPVVIALGILCWMLYFWESGKWKYFWASSVLLLLTQENMSLALVGFALCFIFQKKNIKKIILLIVIGFAYLFLARFMLQILNNGIVEYAPHFPMSPIEFFTQFFNSSEKQQTWIFSYGWFSFLPLFSVGADLAVVLNVFQYFVLGGSAYWSPFTHHHVLLAIFLLIGSVDVLLFLKKKGIRIPILILIILPIFLQMHYHFVFNKLFKSSFFQQEQWMEDNNSIIKKIPPTASIASQQSLIPQITHREYVYLLYPVKKDFKESHKICGEKSCWWLDFAGKPTLLLVDVHPGVWLTMTLTDTGNFLSAVHNMEKAGVITPVDNKGAAKLFRINYQKLQGIR